eukprot:TRINITY_DN24188_c0_g1_i1.p1 TRINITY_DN24188_c0_g1~~TRINITY_DN24188_c0_g1_i1.p1  ORF type:complete len:164 (-),score=14.37 TRINITY_DN24188_c0_g1_i1:197-688(-)
MNLHNAVGVQETSMPDPLKELVVPSHLQKVTSRHLKATGKKVSSKFLKDSAIPTQGAPVASCLPLPSADTDRLKHVRIPTTAPPQTKLTVSSTAARTASCVGSSLPVRRPLQPIHGNSTANRYSGRSAGPRKRHQIQPQARAQMEPVPKLPSPKSSFKRRRLN